MIAANVLGLLIGPKYSPYSLLKITRMLFSLGIAGGYVVGLAATW